MRGQAHAGRGVQAPVFHILSFSHRPVHRNLPQRSSIQAGDNRPHIQTFIPVPWHNQGFTGICKSVHHDKHTYSDSYPGNDHPEDFGAKKEGEEGPCRKKSGSQDEGTASASLMVTLRSSPTNENRIPWNILWYTCELRSQS